MSSSHARYVQLAVPTAIPAAAGAQSRAVASAAVEIRGVTKRFRVRQQDVEAVGHIDLSVPDGCFLSIVGPSGCGKSTIIKMIAGFVSVTTGEICVRGRRIQGIADDSGIGYVAQDNQLFPWLTTAANVAFPLESRGWPLRQRQERVAEMLALVGLSNAADKYIHQLSGGMKKRAAIAQALSYDPAILLMDEPFGSLDSQTRMILQRELQRIWQRTGKTILFVTHDLVEAIALSDVAVVLSNGPGVIKAQLAVTLSRPRDIFNIHTQPGFAETYRTLWPLLHDEIETP